jgi:hypothetical protein
MPKAFAFLALDARREAPGYAEAIAERAQVRVTDYRKTITPHPGPLPRERERAEFVALS